MYQLRWNDEIIEEEIETLDEAEFLQGEYKLAFHDNNIEIEEN